MRLDIKPLQSLCHCSKMCVVKTNSHEAWERLLSFAPTHLYAPSRGGKRRSLATTINKQLDNENGPPESLIHAQERR